MSDDHHTLIQEARAEHPRCCVGCPEPICVSCSLPYPCLPARLAEALEHQAQERYAIGYGAGYNAGRAEGRLEVVEAAEQTEFELSTRLSAAERRVAELERERESYHKGFARQCRATEDIRGWWAKEKGRSANLARELEAARAGLQDETYPCPGHHCEHGRTFETTFDECPGCPDEDWEKWACPTYRDECAARLTVGEDGDFDEWSGRSWIYPVVQELDDAHNLIVEGLNENEYRGEFWAAVTERQRLAKLLDCPLAAALAATEGEKNP